MILPGFPVLIAGKMGPPSGQVVWSSQSLSESFIVPAGVFTICGLCVGRGGNGSTGNGSNIGGGGGGSGGENGIQRSAGGHGGDYGGGGGGGNNGQHSAGTGGDGAIRIIWGPGRSYPSSAGDI